MYVGLYVAYIIAQNFTLKSQAIAEKTAKNSGATFYAAPYISPNMRVFYASFTGKGRNKRCRHNSLLALGIVLLTVIAISLNLANSFLQN